ncbi:membrane associated rhomboid family serine protease [Terracoccus luteus]|uniref:Membrane associated rhomboid family serine protease n=1 Tax=Terracoccus luteus TaxID=53356 RepID=A0A495Y4Q0_9MICO|nr:rhomboid family intramembrane serine protease [Terracoccus luteus]RKT79688.1 membrane associated rhomboid family serine protease [Terracoccus luteus]
MSDNGTGGQPPTGDGNTGPGVPAPAPSVCPRHPDRESYVRCQRCGRPACPECQRPAPVGIQCVDCVREAARTTPGTTTVFGGRVTDGRPVVTYAIIAVCAVVYLLQRVDPGITDRFAFLPALGWTEPWRFVTAAFLHSPFTFFHILLNMFALWSLGQYLEPMLGRARFAALYLISGIGGQVAVTLLAGSPTIDGLNAGIDQSWLTSVVGASGAIFGLFGALLVLNRHLGRSSSAMYVTIAINAVFGFLYPGISWQAHLGGFVTGLACAGVIVALRSRQVRHLVWAALGGVLVLLVVITVGKYLTLPDAVRLISSRDFS